MRSLASASLFLAFAAVSLRAGTSEPPPRRFVDGQELVSTSLPAIRVKVAPAFQYVGTFHFNIRSVAEGDRYVFVDADGGQVKRMFIAQFEGFLPSNRETYNYSFKDALVLGGHRFKHNTFAFSKRADESQNPKDEGVLTAEFLRDRDYRVDDELMWSRFVTVPDKERRHELILFYIENVKSTGSALADFYKQDKPTSLWNGIRKGLAERSLREFQIMP
jgi:hypothetical protein